MKALVALMVVAAMGCSAGNGANGGDGSDGQRGPAGPPGADGKEGPQGPAGPAGKDSAATYKDGSRLAIRTSTWSGADGAAYSYTGGFVDSKFGPCTALFADDGIMRCMPFNLTTIYYLDAACSNEVAVLSVPACGADLPAYVTEYAIVDACTYKYKVRALGAVIAPAAVWMKDAAGVCKSTNVFPPPSAYFEVGAVIPAAEFVAIDIETDP